MAIIATTIPADIFGLAFANFQSCFTFSIFPPSYQSNYSYFYLDRLVCRHRTTPTMKSSFHPVYKYIFCLPSRRSRQIIGLTPRIIYSLLLLLASFSYVNASALSFSLVWQHVPDFSFSLVCVLQHFVSSIGTFHTPLSRQQWLLLNHTYTFGTDIFRAYQNDLPQNNDINNYSFCT